MLPLCAQCMLPALHSTHPDNLKQGMRPSTHGHFPSQPNPTQLSTPIRNYLHRRFIGRLSRAELALGGAADSGSNTRFCLLHILPSASVVRPLLSLMSLICERKPSLYTFSIFIASLSASMFIPSRIMFFLSINLDSCFGASGCLSDWHLFDLY